MKEGVMKILKFILLLLIVGACRSNESNRIRNMIMPGKSGQQESEKIRQQENNPQQNSKDIMSFKAYYESYVIAAQALWGLMEFEEETDAQPSELNLTVKTRRLGRATPPPTTKPIVWKRDIELPSGKRMPLFHPMIMVKGKMKDVDFMPQNRQQYLQEAKSLDGIRIAENRDFARKAGEQNNLAVEQRTKDFFAEDSDAFAEVEVFYGGGWIRCLRAFSFVQ